MVISEKAWIGNGHVTFRRRLGGFGIGIDVPTYFCSTCSLCACVVETSSDAQDVQASFGKSFISNYWANVAGRLAIKVGHRLPARWQSGWLTGQRNSTRIYSYLIHAVS